MNFDLILLNNIIKVESDPVFKIGGNLIGRSGVVYITPYNPANPVILIITKIKKLIITISSKEK